MILHALMQLSSLCSCSKALSSRWRARKFPWRGSAKKCGAAERDFAAEKHNLSCSGLSGLFSQGILVKTLRIWIRRSLKTSAGSGAPPPCLRMSREIGAAAVWPWSRIGGAPRSARSSAAFTTERPQIYAADMANRPDRRGCHVYNQSPTRLTAVDNICPASFATRTMYATASVSKTTRPSKG